MKTLLIPINFREDDANVVTFGVSIARSLGMNAKLFHVISRPVIPTPGVPQATSLGQNTPPGELLEEQMQKTEKNLASIAKRVKEETGVQCQYECKIGFVDSQILDQGEEHETAMIVMGAPHQVSWLNQLIGSRSYTVVNKANIPLLIVPLTASYKTIHNIVVGVEFEDWDNERDDWLRHFASAQQAKLHYVRVVSEASASEQQALKSFREKLKQKPALQNSQPEVSLTVNSDVDSGIWNYVNKVDGDLIAIQRSDKTFWDHLFSENVTKELVFVSDVPVLIF